MSLFRGSSLLVSAVVIACVVSLGGTAASASPSAPAALAPAAPAAAAAAAPLGQPPYNAPMAQGNYFSFPNKSAGDRAQIRNRVLGMVNSTWGNYTTPGPVDPNTGQATVVQRRGSISMTTWSFNDPGMRDALLRAARRGVMVQIIAADEVNKSNRYRPWSTLRDTLNSPAYRKYNNWAHECHGSCRGRGGTPHSKFFLFDDVGSRHIRNVTVQTSMNLTAFAVSGQWNSATVMYNPTVFNQFMTIFREAAVNRPQGANSFRRYSAPNVYSIFFPGGSLNRDPVMQTLNAVRCAGAQSGGIAGRTRIRVIQYAIYDPRGTAIAKNLRRLWNAGCNVRIIYSVTSRPVLKILRSKSGRGPVPMKQSVIKNRAGNVVKYNHSKWVAISGGYGASRTTWTVLNGSANWSNFSYNCDEQMQQIFGAAWVNPYFVNFDQTWAQRSSKSPKAGGIAGGARTGAGFRSVPEQPVFGTGIYRYMSEGG